MQKYKRKENYYWLSILLPCCRMWYRENTWHKNSADILAGYWDEHSSNDHGKNDTFFSFIFLDGFLRVLHGLFTPLLRVLLL